MKKIILFLIINTTVFTQVTQKWVAFYNGPGNSLDVPTSMALDRFGNIYVTGKSFGTRNGYDYATIKYNSNGIQEWVQRYSVLTDTSSNCATSIVVDDSSNVYVTGYSAGNGTGYDIATIKYSSTGAQQWVKRYNGPGNGNDCGTSIDVDNMHNIYITGYSLGNGTNYDFVTIQYNSSGVQQWVQRYNGWGNSDDIPTNLTLDNSNSVLVTGYSALLSVYSVYTTIKYSNTGVQQWVQRYTGPDSSYNRACSIMSDSYNNVYITGTSNGIGSYSDYATIKYNSSGTQQWVQRYNGTGNGGDYASAIKVDNIGNVYVTGYSAGAATNVDYATIKYNSSGVQQWLQRYNSEFNLDDYATALTIDSLGNCYVTGYSASTGNNFDYATVKYNSTGVQQWVQRYNGPGNNRDWAYAIVADNYGNVYITGAVTISGLSTDYATVKYSMPTLFVTDTNSLTPLFYWDRISGATWYHLQISLDSMFSNIIWNSGNIPDTFYRITPLGWSCYYARYKGLTAYDSSNYSSPIYFCLHPFIVSGTVRYNDNNQTVTSGYVKALELNRITMQVVTVDSTNIQNNGTYGLIHMPHDSTFIMAYGNDEDFVPTYHDSTIYWQNASVIYPNSNMNNVDVKVYRINKTPGQMHIAGGVFTSSYSLIGLQNAITYVKLGNQFKAFGISDVSGSYIDDSLSQNNYTVICDRIGYNGGTRNVNLASISQDTINFYLLNIIGINPKGTPIPTLFKLYQNYPNPFNPSTTIKLDIPASPNLSKGGEINVKIIVYDLLGREIVTLVNEQLNPGTYKVEWNAGNYASGLYFYKLSATSGTGEFTETKKLVLLK